MKHSNYTNLANIFSGYHDFCLETIYKIKFHVYLHLFEVTNSLDGQFALYWRGRVTWFQLNDGLSPSLQAFQVSFEFIQLLFLIL